MIDMTTEEFLKSGLLEQRVMGLLSDKQVAEVDAYIAEHPEVSHIYSDMQDSISQLADSYGISPPPGSKSAVLKSIRQQQDATQLKKNPTITWVTAVAFIGLAAYAVLSWSQLQTAKQQLKNAKIDYAALQDDCRKNKARTEEYAAQLLFYTDGNLQVEELSGNDKLAGFAAVTHFNKDLGKYSLEVLELGDMPSGKCMYLWGDVDGKMIKLEKINPDSESAILAFDPRMTSFNITLEDEGKDIDHPDVANLVASISI